jgi:hypothetical protein
LGSVGGEPTVLTLNLKAGMGAAQGLDVIY